jgi:hypothetical protein
MKNTSRRRAGIALAAVAGLAVGGIGIANAAVSSPDNTLTTITPCRLVDTRDDSPVGERLARIGEAETVTLSAVGDNGDCVGIADNATAIVVNVIAVNATTQSYFTLWPADVADKPFISQLNFRESPAIESGTTTVTLSDTGEFDLYNNQGTVELVIDILGYYTPASVVAGDGGPVDHVGPGSRCLAGRRKQSHLGHVRSVVAGHDDVRSTHCR